jgi:hypothetical protein
MRARLGFRTLESTGFVKRQDRSLYERLHHWAEERSSLVTP